MEVTEKYEFYTPEDKEARKKEKEKAWNHRKLRKVVPHEHILSYHELLEMKIFYEHQLEQSKEDLERLQQQVQGTRERIKQHEENLEKWKNEIKQAEEDIPEIGETAAKERAADAQKRAKHEANLRGKGKGRALEFNPDTGEMVDKTGTKK